MIVSERTQQDWDQKELIIEEIEQNLHRMDSGDEGDFGINN